MIDIDVRMSLETLENVIEIVSYKIMDSTEPLDFVVLEFLKELREYKIRE